MSATVKSLSLGERVMWFLGVNALGWAVVTALLATLGKSSVELMWIGIVAAIGYMFVIIPCSCQGLIAIFNDYVDVVICAVVSLIFLSACSFIKAPVHGSELSTIGLDGAIIGAHVVIPLIYGWVANRSLVKSLITLPAKLFLGVLAVMMVLRCGDEAVKAKDHLVRGEFGKASGSGIKAVAWGTAGVKVLGFYRRLMPNSAEFEG